MHAYYKLGARLAFLFEKRSKPYINYGVVSVTEEKADVAQEILVRKQLYCVAGRIGL